ncbi:MAG TPA: MFS transporter [Bryobacteraceae bacterium]|jgi:MFS family permease|nr:MFS transporter [Bryobacteraceae bacterium]
MAGSPRAQQHSTRAAFFVLGFAVSAWAPLVPFVKARTGLDDGALGLLLLCLGAGSLVAMPLAGALTARHGCRKALIGAVVAICPVLPALSIVKPAWLLGATLFCFGAALGAMDCAMNMQAVMVERESGRAMMSGFHAFYSIGGFAGAAAMATLLSAGAPAWLACVAIDAIILGLFAISAPHWRTDRVSQDAPIFAVPRGVVLLIGALCLITFLAEGSMLDWSAVFLHEQLGVALSRAGLGFAVFSATMTIMRLLGDFLVQRAGRIRAIAMGGVCACVGFLIATLVPVWEAALAGYTLVGLGCANIVPVLYSLTGQQQDMPERLAIPAITTMGYAGILAGPALIGFVAHSTSLSTAFTAVAASMLVVAISMRWLKERNI